MYLIVFVCYLMLVVVVARLLAKHMNNLSDFFLAGRSLPGIAIALTFVASWFGAGSTMGSMNEAYTKGISALWLIAIPSILSCLIVGLFLAKQVRKLDTLTQPEAVEKQYGPTGSFLLAWIILASITTFIASQLVAAGQLLEMTTGLPPLGSVLAILGAIVVYSVLGGFRAVVVTDMLQFFCFTSALLILFVFALVSPLPNNASLLTNSGQHFLDPLYEISHHVGMVITFVLAWSIAPEMWQRMSASKTPKLAQKAALRAGLLLACLYGLVISTGMLAGLQPPLAEGEASKNVLLALAFSLPSPLLTAWVLIGVLSAITSTIDSSLNVGSLTFTRDIVHRHLWPQASEGQLVALSRWATAFIGLPGACIALYFQDIIRILWMSADIYASTMLVPILGLFYIPKSGRLAGILGMVFGAIPVTLSFIRDFNLVQLGAWLPAYPYTTLIGVSLSVVGFAAGYALHHWRQGNKLEKATL